MDTGGNAGNAPIASFVHSFHLIPIISPSAWCVRMWSSTGYRWPSTYSQGHMSSWSRYLRRAVSYVRQGRCTLALPCIGQLVAATCWNIWWELHFVGWVGTHAALAGESDKEAADQTINSRQKITVSVVLCSTGVPPAMMQRITMLSCFSKVISSRLLTTDTW